MQLTTELPFEILLVVFSHCSRHVLTQLLRTNRYVHDIAIRVLYTTIPRLSVETSTECFTSLCLNDFACKFVRTLIIRWEDVLLKHEIPGGGTLKNIVRYGLTRAFLHRRLLKSRFALLRTLLKRLVNLTSLTLIVSAPDSLSDVYACDILPKPPPFALTSFKTSFIVSTGVRAFLQQQQDLRELYLDSGSSFAEGSAVPSSVCPKLEKFIWSWGHQRELVAAFLKDRSLKHVAVVLSQKNAMDTIAMLGNTVPTLESLVVTIRDPLSQDLLDYATSRLPCLLQLKLSLPTVPPQQVMDSMAAFTARRHTLRSLYLVIRGVQMTISTVHCMRNIVTHWVASCPTLEVIHFPEVSGRLTKKAANYNLVENGSNGCCGGTCLTVMGYGKRTVAVVSLSRGPCMYRSVAREDHYDVPGGKAQLIAYLPNKM